MITTKGKNTVVKYAPFRGTTDEEAKEHYAKRPRNQDLLLCINCGYTAYHAWGCYYLSHVNIMYEAGTRGVWSIGEEYLLKELAIEEEIWGEQSWLGPEYAITRFLEANSKIPVVKYVKHWTDSESHFFFMKRIPGESLYKMFYDGITRADLLVLAEEAADYLVELRSFTSDKLEAPGGDPVRDKKFNPQHPPHFWTSDVDKWWAGVEPHIKDKSKEGILKEKYGLCVKPEGPFVLSHGDLNAQNIIVKDNHISGIIDWERGGYLPVWWEWRQLTRVQMSGWGNAVIEALGKRNALPSEEEMTLWKSFYNIFYDAYEDKTGVHRNPKWKTNDREFYLTQPSYPHYRAEEKSWYCEDIAKRNREGIQKIEAEKKAIEDRIKTAEDRAKVAEEKLAENETIVAEFNKLSVEERENLKRRK